MGWPRISYMPTPSPAFHNLGELFPQIDLTKGRRVDILRPADGKGLLKVAGPKPAALGQDHAIKWMMGDRADPGVGLPLTDMIEYQEAYNNECAVCTDVVGRYRTATKYGH